MNKKVIIITIIINVLLIVGALFINYKIKDQPIKYNFYSEEDEQLFRQVVGKPEGDINIEDALYFMDIGRIAYENHNITRDSIESKDHKIVIVRKGRTNEEIIASMIIYSKFNIFVDNMDYPNDMLDEYMIEKMITSKEAIEKNPDVYKYLNRRRVNSGMEMIGKLQGALARGQERGLLPQYEGIKSYIDLEPEDWRVLYKWWEENIE